MYSVIETDRKNMSWFVLSVVYSDVESYLTLGLHEQERVLYVNP